MFKKKVIHQSWLFTAFIIKDIWPIQLAGKQSADWICTSMGWTKTKAPYTRTDRWPNDRPSFVPGLSCLLKSAKDCTRILSADYSRLQKWCHVMVNFPCLFFFSEHAQSCKSAVCRPKSVLTGEQSAVLVSAYKNLLARQILFGRKCAVGCRKHHTNKPKIGRSFGRQSVRL